MARKRSDDRWKGKSIKDLENLGAKTIEKLSRAELGQVVTRLASAANKRVRRMKAAGLESPAVRSLERSGGSISVKGKTKEQLVKEFARARGFLQSETATQRGYKKMLRKTRKKLEDAGVKIPGGITLKQMHNQFDRFFRAYERLREMYPNIDEMNQKYVVMNQIARLQRWGVDWESIADRVSEDMEQSYKEEQLRQRESDDLSSFFDLGSKK